MEESIWLFTTHALWTWHRTRELLNFDFSKAVFIFWLHFKVFVSFRSWLRCRFFLLLLWIPIFQDSTTCLWCKALLPTPLKIEEQTKNTNVSKLCNGQHALCDHSHAQHHSDLCGHTRFWPQMHWHIHIDTTQNHLINIPDKAKPYSTHLIFLLSRKTNSCHCPPSRTKRLFTLTRFANKALHQDWQPPKLSASATAW